MKKRLRIAVLLLTGIVFFGTNQAQEEIIIGKKYTMRSAVLGEDRAYWVALPADYSNSKYLPQQYPVVYLLDGDANFNSFTSLQQSLAKGPYAMIPQMIVVGVLNTDRTRDMTPTPAGRTAFYDKQQTMFRNSGGNASFIRFLEKELRPRIDSQFRTNGFNTLVGHSFGGLTAVNILLNHTPLFNSYIIIDPSLWWDNEVILRQADSLLPKKDFARRNIYVAHAWKEIVPQDTTTDHQRAIRYFGDLLERTQPKGLRWHWQYYPNEDHGTITIPAAYDALKFIYKGQQVHVKQAVDDPDLVVRHYANLSKQLGITVQPSEPYLDWMGNYCLTVNRPEPAIRFYQQSVAIYPRSKNTCLQLAKAWRQKGDTTLAAQWERRAEKL
ncbi:MAG: alpha/beta hydrolase-fold protein [Candidatus Pseudobacter hemicellulosilyticus]|uniref:Alpha/beta hydrolase-fold protein n=1 Tax=Candidatus Pseudobacter hemicellulosilyticus TaxID=3121375 RepID=A0AAJ5WRH8_9BACT|nr:MAG: alpha/beta hydrolase-fold protein [Pseudobacter sp.]